MNTSDHLRELWSLAGDDLTTAKKDNYTFDPVGLILLAPLTNFNYWCTPTNTLTFATTGGDGVHFGLLNKHTSGLVTDSPIVMTVPMCGTPNLIVGDNLLDFLSLGCRFGYFSLEQLIYDRQSTLNELSENKYADDTNKEKNELLKKIEYSFGLKPWPEPGQHLNYLQEKYYDTIILASNVVRDNQNKFHLYLKG